MLRIKDEINSRMMHISEELINFKDINVLYKELLSETINLIQGAESGSILIYNKKMDYMDYVTCIGYDEEALRKVHFKKEELFLYETTGLKYPDIVKYPISIDEKILDKHNFDDMMKSNSLSIKVCLCAPLYINGEFLGTITVDSKTNENAFDKNDIKLISYISLQLEIAIKNASLMQALEESLRTDKLTNLYNRRYFEETIEKSFINGEFQKRGFSVVMIDLDDFKIINDTYGHKIGDEVLVFFAQIINECIRHGDLAVRYAGDEFVLFLNNTNKAEALNVIDRIREALLSYSNGIINISFSAGICEYSNNISLDKLITIADDNMYIDKRKKKL